ncbi:MAG: GtrA family protein [Kiritimatiellaeota bacterium]|nr:GtrA family protein [Kiritimatiellota bacterium]
MIKNLKRQFGHDVHPLVQFIKYGLIGGLSTGVSIVVFYLLGWKLLPCLTQEDIMVKGLNLTVPPISKVTREWNSIVCSTVGFVISNVVCYILNRLCVFKPGRHRMMVEFALFFGVSGLSWALGTTTQWTLIHLWDIQTTGAFAANILCALLINYAMRKFFIFKG